MKSVILQEFVTIDGMAADEKGQVDFVPASAQGDRPFQQHQMDFMDSIDTILLGRVTYEMFSAYWPNVTTGDDRPFADKINATPKIVFSKTLKSAQWGTWNNAKVVKGSAAKELAKLKAENGKGMVIWGSISLTQSLMKEGLIDEYQLFICPLTLGAGRPLFEGRKGSFDMKMARVRQFDRLALLAFTGATARTPSKRRR